MHIFRFKVTKKKPLNKSIVKKIVGISMQRTYLYTTIVDNWARKMLLIHLLKIETHKSLFRNRLINDVSTNLYVERYFISSIYGFTRVRIWKKMLKKNDTMIILIYERISFISIKIEYTLLGFFRYNCIFFSVFS